MGLGVGSPPSAERIVPASECVADCPSSTGWNPTLLTEHEKNTAKTSKITTHRPTRVLEERIGASKIRLGTRVDGSLTPRIRNGRNSNVDRGLGDRECEFGCNPNQDFGLGRSTAPRCRTGCTRTGSTSGEKAAEWTKGRTIRDRPYWIDSPTWVELANEGWPSERLFHGLLLIRAAGALRKH
jgi:hypothetical protein